jgi:hypothetical protein
MCRVGWLLHTMWAAAPNIYMQALLNNTNLDYKEKALQETFVEKKLSPPFGLNYSN